MRDSIRATLNACLDATRLSPGLRRSGLALGPAQFMRSLRNSRPGGFVATIVTLIGIAALSGYARMRVLRVRAEDA